MSCYDRLRRYLKALDEGKLLEFYKNRDRYKYKKK